MAVIPEKHQKLIEQALQLKKFPLGKLISIIERETGFGTDIYHDNRAIMRFLAESKAQKTAAIIGWTGTPGAGKSTLLGRLAQELLVKNQNLRIAILAIDPTSHISGGSLLGDRTRTKFATDELRIFFRSQASNLSLGGISDSTYAVVRLLSYFFDVIFIETVGIGQNEIEIRHLADYTYLLVQPMSGDHIQFMKSGIMEIPDAFIVNKCDEEKQAKKSYYQLQSSLKLLTRFDFQGQAPPVYLTSALTSRGIDDLSSDILNLIFTERNTKDKNRYFIRQKVYHQYGMFGLKLLDQLQIPAAEYKNYEEVEYKIFSEILSILKGVDQSGS